MPSARTRQAYANIVLAQSQDALADAATAVADATATLTTVQDTIGDIQEGTLDLDAVKIGGQRYVTSGGALVAEP